MLNIAHLKIDLMNTCMKEKMQMFYLSLMKFYKSYNYKTNSQMNLNKSLLVMKNKVKLNINK